MAEGTSHVTHTVAGGVLTKDDAVKLADETQEAMHRYRELALELKVPNNVITSYEKKYTREETYRRLISWFLKREEPKPTWKAFVAALWSPRVNLPKLAMGIEEKYCAPPETYPCKLQVMIDSSN